MHTLRLLLLIAASSMVLFACGPTEEIEIPKGDADIGAPTDTLDGSTDTGPDDVGPDTGTDADTGGDSGPDCKAPRVLCGDLCCAQGEQCIGGECRCTPEEDSETCERAHATCGPLTAENNCGTLVTVSCGACADASLTCVDGACISCTNAAESVCHDYMKQCGRFVAPDACRVVRDVNCGTCADGEYCVDNECGPARAPANDECGVDGANAERVYFDANGKAKLEVLLDQATDSGIATCYGSVGLRDRVYKIVVDGPSELSVQADAEADAEHSRIRPVIFLLADTCDSFGDDIACDFQAVDDYFANTRENPPMFTRMLGAGTYYLWVEGTGVVEGRGKHVFVNMTLKHTASLPHNALCPAADLIELPQLGPVVTKGSTLGAPAPNDVRCNDVGHDGGTVYYRFTLNEERSLDITVQGANATPVYRTAFALFSAGSCESRGAPVLCTAGDPNDLEGWDYAHEATRRLAPGPYLLAVSGAEESRGDFTLTLDVGAPFDGTCESPIELKSSDFVRGVVGGEEAWTATLVGDTSFGSNQGDQNCASYDYPSASGGRDLLYSFRVPLNEPMYLTATGTRNTSNPDVEFLVGLREQCDRTGAKTPKCATMGWGGAEGTLAQRELLPGKTYYLWVDSYGPAAHGPFRVQLVATRVPAPPINDRCGEALDLSERLVSFGANGALSATLHGRTGGNAPGTLVGANAETKAGCAAEKYDVVYKLVLAQAKTLRATVSVESKSGTPLFPLLALRGSCDPYASDIACSDRAADNPAQVDSLHRRLDPGTYYLHVAARTDDAEDFFLDVTLLDEFGHGGCAEALDLNAALDGAKTITYRLDSWSGGAEGNHHSIRCGAANSGKQYYFKYVVPAGKVQTLTAVSTASPRGRYQGLLSLIDACGATDDVACSADPTGVGKITNITYQRAVAGQTLYFVADVTMRYPDGIWQSLGDDIFDFKFSVAENSLMEAGNDQCPVQQISEAHDLIFAWQDGVGTASAQGTTLAGGDDAFPGGKCFGYGVDHRPSRGGGDVVYRFVLDSVSKVQVTVDSKDGAYLPAFYVRAECNGEELPDACLAAAEPVASLLDLGTLAGGTYYLWVDTSVAGNEGSFALSVRAEPFFMEPPANDLCTGAEALQFTQGRAARVAVSSRSPLSNYVGTCGNATGGDLVYSFTLSSPKKVVARAIPAALNDQGLPNALRPVLYLRDECESAAAEHEVGCSAASAVRGAATLMVSNLPARATPYYLIVDGAKTSWGTFDLEVELFDVSSAPENCFQAERLNETMLSAPGGEMLEGDTTYSYNDLSPTVASQVLAGPDVVYELTLGTEADLDASLLFASVNGSAGLYLTTGASCAEAQVDPTMANVRPNGGPVALHRKRLQPGTYWLWVDSNSIAGPYRLTVALSQGTLPQATSCSLPKTFTYHDGYALASGATEGLAGAHAGLGTCANLGGPEAIFLLAPPTSANATVIVTAASGSPDFVPAFYLREACEETTLGNQLLCTRAPKKYFPASASINLRGSAYYLFVEDASLGAVGGAFDVRVEFGPLSPYPDQCAEAAEITLVDSQAMVNLDTYYAQDDHRNTYAACNAPTAKPVSARDVVYKLDTSSLHGKVVQVSLEGASSVIGPQLTVRTVCGALTEEPRCAHQTYAGTPAVLSFVATEDTYYIWADGLTTDPNLVGKFGGDGFLLTVRVTDAPPVPAPYGSCGDAKALVLQDGYFESVDTNAYGRADDTAPGQVYAGPSTYYKFKTGAAGKYFFSVIPARTTPSYQPAIYIRTAATCMDSSAPVAAYALGNATTGRIALEALLAADTSYTLAVDGAGDATKNTGSFKLQVAYLSPATNDCATPGDLVKLQLSETPTTFYGTTAGGVSKHGYVSLISNPNPNKPLPTMSGPEHVFVVDTTGAGAKNLVAELTPLGASGFHPVIVLRKVCECTVVAGAAANQLVSSEKRAYKQDGVEVGLIVNKLPEGKYYLVVDTYANSASLMGAYRLRAWLSDSSATPPKGDTCDDRLVADPFVNGISSIKGLSFEGMSNDLDFDAKGMTKDPDPNNQLGGPWKDRPEYMIQIVIPEDIETPYVDLAIVSNWPQTLAFDYTLQRGCGDNVTANQLTGATQTMILGYPVRQPVRALSLTPGDYTLTVEGDPISLYGFLDFEFSLMPPTTPTHALCAGAKDLDLSSGRAWVDELEIANAADVYSSEAGAALCARAVGPNFFYRIEQENSGPMRFDASVVPSSNGLRPFLSLRHECSDVSVSSEMICNYAASEGGDASISIPELARGTYYLVVDSQIRAEGGFRLDVSLSPIVTPASNDRCAGATPLNMLNGRASVTARIEDGRNNYSGMCGDWGNLFPVADWQTYPEPSMPGPDRVYSFVPAVDSSVSLTVTSSGGFAPGVYLRTNCEDTSTGSELLCGAPSGFTARASRGHVAAGVTYYVIVDSVSTGARGAYTLDVVLGAAKPPPPGDTCADAIEIAANDFGRQIPGSTIGAASDFARPSACKPTANTWGSYQYRGADIVYTFKAIGEGTNIIVRSKEGFDASVWIMPDSCVADGSTCAAFSDGTRAGGQESLIGPPKNLYFSTVNGKRYYVVVDSQYGVEGDFTIEIIDVDWDF